MNRFDRSIARNPKYEHVQSTLDTGNSLTKYLKRHEDLRGSGKQLADETFQRMKISTLVQLIIQVADIETLITPKSTEFDSFASQRIFPDSHRSHTQDNLETTRSKLEDLIRGVGEMDVYQRQYFSPSLRSQSIDRPYLLVDLRDHDAFQTNHIISAHHYPTAMLSRCSNNETKELLVYKNQKGKIIILYDEDERIASPAATIMVERGYNNIFLLSGGLRHAIRKFPRGLLTGTCPLSWTISNPPQTASTKRKSSIHSNGRPSITFPPHEYFTPEDLEELNTQLEKHSLLSRSTASKQTSRSSIASKQSTASNASAKPWKP